MRPRTWTMMLAVGLGILVILVGVLQRRWIEEIERHEHYFRHRQISYSTWLFKVAFDRELDHLARSFEGVPPLEGALARELAARRERWRETTRWPGLLRAVSSVDTSAEPIELAMLDEEGRFEPVTSDPTHPLLDLLRTDALPEGSDPRGTTISASVPAIVIPSTWQPGGPTIILELDRDYMRTRLIPELTLWMHPSLTFEDVELAVVESASGRLLYASSAIDSAAELGRVDVEYGLAPLGLGPLPPSFFGDDQQTIPSTEWQSTEEDRAWFRALWSELFYAGHWRVLVRRGELPIEQEVAAWASRETLIALLTLGLLGASILVLVRATRGAQRFARQQLDLVARVTHELRTPLAVLAAAGENLSDDLVHEPARRRQYGRLIHREAQRLRETVENVLHLARRDSGAPLPEPQAVDLAALAEEALQASVSALEPDELTVEAELGEHPPIVADAAAVRSAILNLVSNALKYGRSSRWLGLGLERHDGELRFSVSDRGPGIDPDDLSRIFEPYFRGERAHAEQIEGSGLGLAVVREVMSAHGGRVTVRPRPGGGTTFTLCFPLGSSP